MNRLREAREEAVLTISELAKVSGVSEDAICKIENGHRRPRPGTLRRLARALGVKPQELRPRSEIVARSSDHAS
jgi:transcriptional regulator with XRE-family HTH domain